MNELNDGWMRVAWQSSLGMYVCKDGYSFLTYIVKFVRCKTGLQFLAVRFSILVSLLIYKYVIFLSLNIYKYVVLLLEEEGLYFI
jgi:hypothetical protein